MITVRPTEDADLESLEALFQLRFGHGLTPAEWTWKYRHLPGAARSMVAVDATGAVVAHAGALRLPACWRSPAAGAAPVVAAGAGVGAAAEAAVRDGIWQLVDFAGTTGGGGLRAALVVAGRQLLADLPGPGDAPWIFGFPSERHFRLGERVFGYRPLTRIAPLAGELAAAPRAAATDGDPILESGDSCGEWAAAAWRRCGVSSVERTVAFLNWRYWARPGRYYRVYRLRSATPEAEEGLAVFAFVGDEAWAAELWLPPRGEWYSAMLAVAGDLRAAGLRLWRFWPPPPQREAATIGRQAGRQSPAGSNAALFSRLGLRPDGETRFVGCRGAAGGADPVAAAGGFYYAMGDFDLA